jgi:hypothetical protein
MRGYIRAVFYALIAVICFWFLDALIHSAVHHEETFTESLLFNNKEAAFRFPLSICFLVFSVFMARIIIKQKAAESKPKLATNEWSSAFDICFSSR